MMANNYETVVQDPMFTFLLTTTVWSLKLRAVQAYPLSYLLFVIKPMQCLREISQQLFV